MAVSGEISKAKWGVVDHGADGYEDIINFDEIVFARAFYRCMDGTESWTVKIFLRNRTKQDVHLSEKGYEWFLKNLKADEGHSSPKG